MENANLNLLFYYDMKFFFVKISMLFLVVIFTATIASAQFPNRNSQKEPLPESIKERLVELKIEDEKKEFEKLLNRSKELVSLSEEIQSSFAENKSLTSKDQKKLVRVEKLLKKIRRELRGGKDENAIGDKEKPKTLNDAISTLHKNTVKLYEEVKKTTRHSISVVAIQSSNAVWKLVKFIRFKK